MRLAHFSRTIPAIGLGLALSSASFVFAQARTPSSGSGSGTGTGMSSGFPGSTGTGRESGSGVGTTGTGAEGISSMPLPPALPNANLTRPIDRRGFMPRDTGRSGGMSTVSPDLFLDARSVADPGERALALVRIAQTAIFSKQLDDAHTALFEAGPAAMSERDSLIREQRLSAIVDTLLRLAEERMSEPADIDVPLPPDPVPPPPATSSSPSQTPAPKPPATETPATPPPPDRNARLRAALPEWAHAVKLAGLIDNDTAKVEALFRIAESEAYSSQRLITDPLRLTGGRPDPSKLDPQLRGFTDYLLDQSARTASKIDRPIWRDYAMFTVVSNAAASSQFSRGFQIARGIAQPESRTDALIRLAEGQALNGRPSEATAAYEEAARAVSMIPQEDPRETLVGVLIDSLISFGRFDDARACVPIYSFPSRQLTALSAVAESQGRRGLAESARQWIAVENPAFRPLLYRKVNDGILASIEQNRSKDLSARGQ